MFRNYLRVTTRNLKRNFRYVIINVLGLSIGIGFGLLAFLNYQYAQSFDNWHRNRDRIVRIESVKADNKALYGTCPSPLATDAQQLSGVEAGLRFEARRAVVKYGDNTFNEVLHFADQNFFRIFDFTLISGSTDFSDPSSVLISNEIATKYFGTANPIGKSIIVYADQPIKKALTVRGVIESQQKQSSIRFDFLTHLSNQFDNDKPIDYTNWKYRADAVFLLLKHASDRPAVETSLASFVARQQSADPDWKISRFVVEPFATVALSGRSLRNNSLYPSLPSAAVWGTMAMAIMILLTASLNFANMTIAVCNGRLREIGVRKVLGGTQGQLVMQLLTESSVICALSILLGMILAFPIVSWYNHMWSYLELHIDYTQPSVLAFLLGLLVFVTLLAGSYPAFYVSAFRPTHIFRGALRFGGSGLFSRVMMGMQIAISLTAVVTGLSFERNAEFNRTANVGYDRQNVIGAYVYDESTWQVFKTAAQSIPNIEAVSGTQHLPGFSFTMTNFGLNSESHESMLYNVGDDFLRMLQIQLRDGQPLLPLQGDQPAQTVLVNETFAREFGEGKPLIGQSIRLDSSTYQIGGIVRDFMTNTPFRPISPAIIRPVPASKFVYLIARVKAEHQQQVFAGLERTWKRLFPYKPFDGVYLNNALAEAESVSTSIAVTMGVFSLVTVLLAVSGLFSLISLNVLKRMREVAVRRVLGATGAQVGWVLHKNYLSILAIATILGCSMGYYLAIMLMNSVFKINNGISVGAIFLSAMGVLTIAFSTILLKLWQTLQLNPVDALKAE